MCKNQGGITNLPIPLTRITSLVIESFNGRFRDECLDEHWFTSLHHAKVVIEAWRREYNKERPKKRLGGLTPSAYAEQLVVKHDKVTSDSKLGYY
ncbi:Transposase [Halomonas sp. R57-5]|nr:Transposase [Halomonas sp. R57-5]